MLTRSQGLPALPAQHAPRAGRPPQASAGHLLLTHLLPGADHQAARAAARSGYDGDISVATAGLALALH